MNMIRDAVGQNSAPYESFLGSMNDLLVSHNVLYEGEFTDSKWTFNNDVTASGIVIDFSFFSSIETDLDFDVSYGDGCISLTACELAKFIWLDLLKSSSTVGYYHVYAVNFLSTIFAFLDVQKITRIEDSDLFEFYGFALCNNVSGGGVTRRFSTPSYQTLAGAGCNLSEISQRLRVCGVTEVLGSFSKAKVLKALDEACRSQLGTTLNDYKAGGSLNFLGLDVGRHYIDHCGNVFENHFQYAASVRAALSGIVAEINTSLGQGITKSIQPIVAHALMGRTLDEIPPHISKRWRMDNLEIIYYTALANFRDNYNRLADISSVFLLETVNSVITEVGLPSRYDAQEFVRSFMFVLYIDSNIKPSDSIFLEYFAALRCSNEAPDISFEKFVEICRKVVSSRRCFLPDDQDKIRLLCKKHSERLCVHSRQNSVRKLKAGLTLVESCGATLFVGLLGWRRSEYGFSLSDIKVEANKDVLDSLYVPFRFNVSWVVPKTSGKTNIDREITLYAYLTLFLLDKINLSNSEFPAVYYAVKSRQNLDAIYDSSLHLGRRVEGAWIDFILYYSEFSRNDLFDDARSDLMDIRTRLLSDLPKYILCEKVGFRDRLLEYCAGTLDVNSSNIIENALPEDILKKLKGAAMNTDVVTLVRSMILQDSVYPTPHAFRHIWAEAVLRRYRGDVGKFIRANFKHLDESFFMAYLRDKETKAVYDVAKRVVINGVVRHQIKMLTNNDRDFAGGFDRFLARAVRSTKVVSLEEIENLARIISHDRIVDIKPNAWVTCLLRVGTERIAKCSEDGVPQRQNAEPKLCLGCVNADISEGNFNGIVVYIKPDIDACRNPSLPGFVKELHIPVVKLALKRIRELGANGGHSRYEAFISHLADTLKIAEDSLLLKKEVIKSD
ncbi:MAG: hypothetical protein ACI87Q_000716 [Pseudohongiellaceae bacterium]|jgi:hypothetical protein